MAALQSYALICPTQIRKLGATATGRDLGLMRPRDALPYSILMLAWCTAAFSPDHGGNHESRPTGSLQVHFGRSAILENSARCSRDGDVFLSTPNEQSRHGGPIGCALHTANSDLGRDSAAVRQSIARNVVSIERRPPHFWASPSSAVNLAEDPSNFSGRPGATACGRSSRKSRWSCGGECTRLSQLRATG